jgi:flagellar motility protein MotE (MotC chaperone)
MAEKRRDLTKDEMAELYRDLKKNMAQVKSGGAAEATAQSGSNKSLVDALVSGIRASMKRDDDSARTGRKAPRVETRATPRAESTSPYEEPPMIQPAAESAVFRGNRVAVACVVLFATAKVILSALESTGFATVAPVQAMVAPAPAAPVTQGSFGPEEVKILTQLDQRRVQLEQRSARLDEREREFAGREQEYQVQLAQIRDLTERLKGERDKTEKKRSNQVDQLANVYSSMQPQEAAKLMEQLDVQIALALMQRMPEKRIGQILALMSPDRALAITRILSGKLD